MNNDKIIIEGLKCKGCNQQSWCDIFNMESDYIFGCPCRLCLLKMICQDSCDKYNRNMETVYEDNKFIMEMKEKRGIE